MTSTITSTRLASARRVGPKLSVLSSLQNLAVAAFGVALIFAVGFLPIAAAHNAAHDTRHALAFPCH